MFLTFERTRENFCGHFMDLPSGLYSQINWVKVNVVLNDGVNDVFYCFCLFFNKYMYIEKHKHYRHVSQIKNYEYSYM